MLHYFVFVYVQSVSYPVTGCQYQCKWSTRKTRRQNDLYYVDRDVKPYSLTHSLCPRKKINVHYTGDATGLCLSAWLNFRAGICKDCKHQQKCLLWSRETTTINVWLIVVQAHEH